MNQVWAVLLSLLVVPAMATSTAEAPPSLLEIHYINVGQGGSTLIKTPNNKVILYDFGNYQASKDLIPYLSQPEVLGDRKQIDYAILSHNDRDHYVGYLGLIEEGYDVIVANYSSGAKEDLRSLLNTQWIAPSKKTHAKRATPIMVGDAISLGFGAEMIVAAANGLVIGASNTTPAKDKNDASISLLIRYGNFHYILDGDLGSGPEACTDHQTEQDTIQPLVAEALIQEGYLEPEYGVDLMHIAHHGSESSTSARYYRLMNPTVGIISVGIKNKQYRHPREDVVERVLLEGQMTRSDCVNDTPPLEYLFQTEDGSTESGESSTGKTNNAGISSGDIIVKTDGQEYFDIYGTNRVHQGSTAEFPEGNFIRCFLDEVKIETGKYCTEIKNP